MADKSPAFQFYPKDYMSDANVLRMTYEERGVYDWLMCSAWLEGWIPADVNELARLCQLTPRKMRKMWERIGPCFEPNGHPDRLVHPRLEAERKKQEDNRAKKQEAGRKGGIAKAEGLANG